MKSGYNAAIFDMDGTILNSMRYWRFTALEYLLAHDLPVDEDILVRMPDNSARKTVPMALARRGIEVSVPDFLPELQHFMDIHYQTVIRPKDGAPEFLRRLKDAGYALSVATAAPRNIASRALARHGLLEMFDFVTDVTEVGLDKADPAFFQRVAERMGKEVRETVIFEDALYAIRGAKDGGFRVCAIEDSSSRTQKSEIMRIADTYVKGYADLLAGSGGYL